MLQKAVASGTLTIFREGKKDLRTVLDLKGDTLFNFSSRKLAAILWEQDRPRGWFLVDTSTILKLSIELSRLCFVKNSTMRVIPCRYSDSPLSCHEEFQHQIPVTCMHEHGVRYCLHARAWRVLHILQNQVIYVHEHGVRVAYFETFYFTNPDLAFSSSPPRTTTAS